MPACSCVCMTPDEINKAIAEHLGWSDVHFYEDDAGPPIHCGYPPGIRHYATIPNYSGDLNAMHEAEKTLDEDQQVDYSLWKLSSVTNCYSKASQRRHGCTLNWIIATATAPQRAEAFLRTIGKYTEA